MLSPAALLVVAALCGRRPRLRGALTLAVLVPPAVTLLPVAVMHGGAEAVAAAAALLIDVVALVLAVASLPGARIPDAPTATRPLRSSPGWPAA